jgi:zona occludens toxin (predicted ATPase)
MMYLFSFKAFADNSLGLTFVIPMPRSENLVLIMALVSLAFNVVYFVLHYRWRFTGKAPANLEVGQSESVL